MKRSIAILSSWASLATPVFADVPRATVDALVVAMLNNDAANVEAMFTEDAGYAYSLDGSLTRGAGFDRWIESDITGPASVFIIEEATVTDGTVDTMVLWGRGGNATSSARYVFTVVDGRIDSWRMTSR